MTRERTFDQDAAPSELPIGAPIAGAAIGLLARQIASGLALASIAGLAMGARGGLASMAVHAAGVPLALIAVAALGLPSLFVLLALADAPLDPRATAHAAARAIGASGLVLAGLAPTMALFVVTSEGTDTAALTSGAGLAIGGALGLGHVVRELHRALVGAELPTRLLAAGGLGAFAVFAAALASRVWSGLLPVLLGGAS